MVGADETLAVAGLAATQRAAAVATLVEEGGDAAVGLTHHDHRVFTHVADEIIARVGQLALGTQQNPGAREDARQFELVNFRVDIHR